MVGCIDLPDRIVAEGRSLDASLVSVEAFPELFNPPPRILRVSVSRITCGVL